MRATPFLLLCACGRIGFDAEGLRADATATVPAIVGATAGPAVAPGATVTVFLPEGTAAGDLMLLVFYANQAGATISAPGEWTTSFDELDTWHLFRAAFYERRASETEADTYSFGVANSNLAGWALTVVRDAPDVRAVDASALVAGTPSPLLVTYSTPEFTASRADRVIALFVDDSGSTGSQGWSESSSAELLADGKRVAIYSAIAGPGPVSLSGDVTVPGTTSPGGAVRVVAWE